jgi:hypothetical protein
MKLLILALFFLLLLNCGPVYDSHFLTLPWIVGYEYMNGDLCDYLNIRYESIRDYNRGYQPDISAGWWKVQ